MMKGYALHYAAEDGNLELVKQLVAGGQAIDTFDEDLAWTPLHHAVKAGHLEVARYLIEQGADVNARWEEKIGETPLGLVAQECSLEMARLLVDAGADPTILGWMQLTALQRAERRKKPEGIEVHALLERASQRFSNR